MFIDLTISQGRIIYRDIAVTQDIIFIDAAVKVPTVKRHAYEIEQDTAWADVGVVEHYSLLEEAGNFRVREQSEVTEINHAVEAAILLTAAIQSLTYP